MPTGELSETLRAAAYKALQLQAGRVLSEAESARALAKLLEFAIIVRSWDQDVKKGSTGVGNV